MHCDSSYANMGEVSVEQSAARSASAPSCSRSSAPAFFAGYADKKYTKGIIQGASARLRQRGDPDGRRSSSRAAPLPMAAIPISTSCIPQQADELDRDKARGDPATRCSSWSTTRRSTRRSGSSRFINGVGPRVGESSFGLIPGFAYTAPFEDLTLKSTSGNDSAPASRTGEDSHEAYIVRRRRLLRCCRCFCCR